MTERELSYRILYNIHIGGELSHIALKNALDECDEKEWGLRKGFVTTLVNGVNERYLTLMYLTSKQAGRPVSKIKPPVRIMLAMGIYQAYYMSVPASAACNESVKLAGKCGFTGLKGFINGVLRGMLRSVENIDVFLEKELADCELTKRLSIMYSCPEWLVDHYIEECGEETTLNLLKASYEKRPLTVYKLGSVNDEEFKDALINEQALNNFMECKEIPGINNAYEISEMSEINSLAAYRKGYFIIQDISSMLATEVLPELKNAEILDVCAAPGGKTIHCADRFATSGCKVTARDLTPDKVELINGTITRTGLKNIKTEVVDALIKREEDIENYDLVIADLPCSGLGVIGRKPDIKYKTKPEDIALLAEIQRNILKNVTSYVKQGGYLAYSTCTLAKQENEENAKFIADCGFEPVEIKSRLPEDYYKYLIGNNSVRLLPDETHDGFYIALFRKTIKNDGDADIIDIKSMTKAELTDYIVSCGYPKYRADQLYQGMHVKLAGNIDDINGLPKEMKKFLRENTVFTSFDILACLVAKSGDTKKYLFGLKDGNAIESVWMKYKHGNSVCISSQVGCRMGCKFCASTIDGLVRNLTAAEMLEQVYAITRETGERVSNIVIMGSGEPFDNLDTVVKFVKMVSDADGLNISQRNITVSTCGIVPGIIKLSELDLNITLAISLHAYNDEKRMELMPIARRYKIQEVIKACKTYFEKTGRRVSFEYSLIKGVNDTPKDAEGLASLLKNSRGHVNLIPVNPIKERDFKRSDIKNVLQFQQMLEKKGINVTIRREMGADIDAACGQLRRSYERKERGDGADEGICSN